MSSLAIAEIPDPALEEEKAARTACWKALEAERLEEARAALVARYRKSPFNFPDGIDAWYRAEEFGPDQGEHIIASPPAIAAQSHGETQTAPKSQKAESHASESHQESQPWKAQGISRATYFRRRAEQKARG